MRLLAAAVALVALAAVAQPVGQPPPTVAPDGGTAGVKKNMGKNPDPVPGGGRGGSIDRAGMIRKQAELAIDPGTSVGAHPSLLTSSDRTTPDSLPHQSAVSDIAAEALGLVAEIAMDRAKKGVLEVVHRQLQTSLCAIPAPMKASLVGRGEADGGLARALPATCDLVSGTALEALVSDPAPLVAALTQDFASLGADLGWSGVLDEEVLREVLSVCARLVTDAVGRRQATFTNDDAWLIVSAMLDQLANSPTIKAVENSDLLVALRTAKACLLAMKADPSYACDVHELTDAVISALGEAGVPMQQGGGPLPAAQRLEAERLASLALQASLALGNTRSTPPQPVSDPRERLRAGVSLAYRIAQTVVKRSKHTDDDKKKALRQLQLHEAMLTAAIDGNQPQMIASGAEYMLAALAAAPQGLPAPDANLVHKTTAVLTAISAYSVTFSQLPATTDTEESRKAIVAARKQVIEDLISATTVRAGREESWVLSLGVPVGFTTGWQWVHGTAPTGESIPLTASAGTGFMPPQLGLGLGVALQRLPKKSENVAGGFHLGLTALDLGLLTAYDSTGRASPPQWDTVLSPGLQLGLILGDPEHTFLIELDARYAPGILASQSADGSSTRGAFRAGITLAYYVPLFDFN